MKIILRDIVENYHEAFCGVFGSCLQRMINDYSEINKAHIEYLTKVQRECIQTYIDNKKKNKIEDFYTYQPKGEAHYTATREIDGSFLKAYQYLRVVDLEKPIPPGVKTEFTSEVVISTRFNMPAIDLEIKPQDRNSLDMSLTDMSICIVESAYKIHDPCSSDRLSRLIPREKLIGHSYTPISGISGLKEKYQHLLYHIQMLMNEQFNYLSYGMNGSTLQASYHKNEPELMRASSTCHPLNVFINQAGVFTPAIFEKMLKEKTTRSIKASDLQEKTILPETKKTNRKLKL